MMQASTLLGLRAVAPIHAGGDDGVVDLPIQREKHNNWPVVFASSVKGALREACEYESCKHSSSLVPETITALFGSETKDGTENMQAGALLVSDMQLLALPVAALDTAFRWVTCPSALARLTRTWTRFGHGAGHAPPAALVKVKPDEAIVFRSLGNTQSKQPAAASDGSAATEVKLFLREYMFIWRVADESIKPWLGVLAHLFGEHTGEDELAQRLVIVSDARFGALAETATSVNAHVALNENKTAKDGALFYEETLPPETLMFLPLACSSERKPDSEKDAAHLLNQALSLFPNGTGFLRVGGNETTGMGWFEVNLDTRSQP